MIQMQITLPENVMDAIRAEAGQLGITPNILARTQLCQLHFPVSPDAHAKMEIKLNDALVNRLEAHLRESEDRRPLGFVIEEILDDYIECVPFNAPGDICVHNDECMHHKSVYRGKEDQHETN
jgi:hypothetical protein